MNPAGSCSFAPVCFFPCVRVWWCLVWSEWFLSETVWGTVWSSPDLTWGHVTRSDRRPKCQTEGRGAEVWILRASAFKFKCDWSVLLCMFGSCEGGGRVWVMVWHGKVTLTPLWKRRAAPRGGGGADGSSDGAEWWGRGSYGGCVFRGVGWSCIVWLFWADGGVLCVFVWVLLKEPSIRCLKVKFKFSGNESRWFKTL